ncbi:hypothetical protein [Micrococcus lylae]|uniref:hypothetical protein n=1 Tax=Micrococcus lylae TaxID=1273 RepID=UPI0008364422|nr:hypothetical protein [Micrococcus lylae]
MHQPPLPPAALRLTIHAPDTWINSNQRLHRMATAKLTAAWRTAAATTATGLPPIPAPVRIIARFYKTRAGRYDPNNLWPTVKACVDGLVDAGLLEDDDHTRVIGPDMRHGGKTTTAYLTLDLIPHPQQED